MKKLVARQAELEKEARVATEEMELTDQIYASFESDLEGGESVQPEIELSSGLADKAMFEMSSLRTSPLSSFRVVALHNCYVEKLLHLLPLLPCQRSVQS